VRVVTIPDAGHMMMLDARIAFVAALAAALRP
jgi:pimeloyl-ACP methyl ester carboxylesterase